LQNRKANDDFLMSRKNDYVFKRVFGDERNKDILISLLNAVLVETVVDVTLLNPEFRSDMLEEKLGILDVKVKTNYNAYIDVEIQLNPTIAFEKRILYYWSKLYSEVLKKGDSYDKLEKTISISILDYNRISDRQLHHRFMLFDRESQILLTDVMEIHYLELRKLKSISKDDFESGDLSHLEQWMYFIATDDREVLEMLSKKNKDIKHAYDIVDIMSKSEVDRRAYEAREASVHLEATIKEGYYSLGYGEGIEQGEEKTKFIIVKNALSKGLTVEDISDITGVPLDEVKRISTLK
jgi:predicted transposase/invertase (TIGR01784 family)